MSSVAGAPASISLLDDVGRLLLINSPSGSSAELLSNTLEELMTSVWPGSRSSCAVPFVRWSRALGDTVSVPPLTSSAPQAGPPNRSSSPTNAGSGRDNTIKLA